MPTRTRLTTPPGQQPRTEDRLRDEERYVPALELPTEPRVPGRHRRKLRILLAVVLVVAIVGGVAVIGEQAQREDPSVPSTPEPDA